MADVLPNDLHSWTLAHYQQYIKKLFQKENFQTAVGRSCLATYLSNEGLSTVALTLKRFFTQGLPNNPTSLTTLEIEIRKFFVEDIKELSAETNIKNLETAATELWKWMFEVIPGSRKAIGTVRTIGSSTTSIQVELEELYSTEVCFLVDCTGSMSSYIKLVKSEIVSIVGKLKEEVPYGLRLAFVGYGDFDSTTSTESDSIVIKFMDDPVSFRNEVHSAKFPLEPGDDYSEDVSVGLEKVLELNWYRGNRIVFHFGDRPCHGSAYITPTFRATPNYDLYGCRDGSPDASYKNQIGQDPRSFVKQLAQRGIKYVFGKISDETDTMVSIFRQVYDSQEGRIADFSEVSYNTVKEVFGRQIFGSIVAFNNHNVRKITNEDIGICENFSSVIPNWNNSADYHTVQVKIFSEEQSEIPTLMKIAKNYFSEGSCRYAHYAKLVIPQGQNSKFFLPNFLHSSSDIERATFVVKRWKGITVEKQFLRCKYQENCHFKAQRIWHIMNSEIGNHLLYPHKFTTLLQNNNLKSLAPNVEHSKGQNSYELKSLLKEVEIFPMKYFKIETGVYSRETWTLEEFIPGTYMKYTNNFNYINDVSNENRDDLKLAQIFSHTSFVALSLEAMTFGHVESSTNLNNALNNQNNIPDYQMVTDIQGVGKKWTDPAVHSKLDLRSYGDTNLGRHGMVAFFEKHNAWQKEHHCELLCCKVFGPYDPRKLQ